MSYQVRPVVVLFARMSSSRLPGKALKRLAGKEILGICIDRLRTTRADLCVLTSTDCSDDKIEEYCRKINVACFRGDLQSPMIRLKEFLFSSDQRYNLVVRVTADNIFPDFHLIEDLIDQSLKRGGCDRYEFIAGGESGLPKGVAVEVIGVELLQESVFSSEDPDILEHITPDLRRKFKARVFGRGFGLRSGDVNVSIDTAEDFAKMQDFWKSDYKNIHYIDLVEKFLEFDNV